MQSHSDVQSDVSADQLGELMARAQAAVGSLRDGGVEFRFPLGFEFSGSPKAGKSTIIGLVSLFLRRAGFRVSQPPEGASLETPPDLKDDLLSFNVWCGCYAVQNILTRSHEGDPAEILILDRGLFDWVVWLEFLSRESASLRSTCDTVAGFALLEHWLRREQTIFVFTANAATSMLRERDSQLTLRSGRAMNPDFLNRLLGCYRDVLARERHRLPNVIEIDTSAQNGILPSFQRIAYEVSNAMLTTIESHADQYLLVVDPIERSGFVDDMPFVRNVCEQAVLQPRLMRRTEAEGTLTVQQLVPYGLIRDAEGRVLVAKRRVEGERPELKGKWTMLFGGHAEQKDLNSGEPEGTFRRCLERELDEELIGVAVQDVKLVGLINHDQTTLGSKHLAIVHEVAVGGRPGIRRQTADREFQRGGTEWRTSAEIACQVSDFDPWSQLVASKLFGANGTAQGGLFSPYSK